MTPKNQYEKSKLLGQAWGHAQLEMFEDSVKDCEALVNLDKDDPYSYIELGYYYQKIGNVERAMDCCRYLMRRFPKYNVAYANLGSIYQTDQKRFDIAMLLYEKALELNSLDTWALNNIGTILQAEGKWKEALSYYEKVTSSAKNLEKDRHYLILHNLGWAYYRCKKYKDAYRVFNYLAGEHEDKPSVFSDFGCVFYKMGRFKDALSSFEIALKLCMDSRYYQRLWKVAYQKRSI